MSGRAGSVVERLEELARISAGGPGVTRLGYTLDERRAHELMGSWMDDAGFAVSHDPAGNLHGVIEGSEPELPPVWIGSHLDTVPSGGPLDGAYGVVGGLAAVVEAIREAPLRPNVEVVAFACEEAARFGAGVLGSRAAVAGWDSMVDTLVDGDGVSLREALVSLGLDPGDPGLPIVAPGDLSCYLELHIEQGPVLERAGVPVGIVTAIAAPTYLRAVVVGEAGHAGTTPMALRRDALAGAAEIVLLAERTATSTSGPEVATVGALAIEPNAPNVVPGRALLSLDVRSIDRRVKTDMVEEIRAGLERLAERRGLEVTVETLADLPPADTDAGLRADLREAVRSLEAAFLELPSGAYHDALPMADVCPIGMLFVPSRGGRSHVPDEWTEPEHLELGVTAFARAIRAVTDRVGRATG